MFAIGVCIVIIIICLAIIARLVKDNGILKRQALEGYNFTPKIWGGGKMMVTFWDAKGNKYIGGTMPEGLHMFMENDDEQKQFTVTFTTK